MISIGTLCGGGEGVGVGAKEAGLIHLWSIESDKCIANVARLNGFNVYIGSIIAPWWCFGLPVPDVLHASPPCPEFSSAKVGGKETWLDIAIAHGVARFIRIMRPRYFTLENVWMYRKSASWRIIAQALGECGYMFDVAYINAADFGVPQTRKRMWARAVRGGLVPPLPPPEPWVGWRAAIEDLLPGLPDDEFAPWQLERMPEALRATVLLAQGHYGDGPLLTRAAEEPAGTVTANANMTGMRALLMSAGNAHNPTVVPADEPARTVVAAHPSLGMRAFLATGQFNKPHGADDRGPQIRYADEPIPTIVASNKGDTRAFIVDGGNASRSATVRRADEPVNTVVASVGKGAMTAFVVDGGNARQDVPTIRDAGEPVFTITASADKAPTRASVAGRVVRMSVRCLARFQSFGDDYILPDSKTLAARVIGNAVPPLLYTKLIRSLIK